MRSLILCLCLALVTARAHPVAAAPLSAEEQASRTFTKRGDRWFKDGRYEKARDAYQAAHTAQPTPELQFRIAQCERLLGNDEEAARGYHTYLEVDPTGSHAEEARAHLTALSPRVAQATPAPAAKPAAQPTPTDAEQEQITAARARALQLEREGVEPSPSRSQEQSSSEEKPLYKKWWLWTIVGGVVVAGVAVGLGVGLTRGDSGGFSPTLPTFGSSTPAGGTGGTTMQLRF